VRIVGPRQSRGGRLSCVFADARHCLNKHVYKCDPHDMARHRRIGGASSALSLDPAFRNSCAHENMARGGSLKIAQHNVLLIVGFREGAGVPGRK
jgi:hypothetical protein